MIAGCIGGAEYINDLKLILQDTGFRDIRMTPRDNSKEIIKSWFPEKNIEEFVASYIVEAVK